VCQQRASQSLLLPTSHSSSPNPAAGGARSSAGFPLFIQTHNYEFPQMLKKIQNMARSQPSFLLLLNCWFSSFLPRKSLQTLDCCPSYLLPVASSCGTSYHGINLGGHSSFKVSLDIPFFFAVHNSQCLFPPLCLLAPEWFPPPFNCIIGTVVWPVSLWF